MGSLSRTWSSFHLGLGSHRSLLIGKCPFMGFHLINNKFIDYLINKLKLIMQSPRTNGKMRSPKKGSKDKYSPSKDKELSPNSRKLKGFKPKNMSDLRSLSPNSRVSESHFSKHEKSFTTLYSKFQQHKTYS